MSEQRGGRTVGVVYVLDAEIDNKRFGSHWFKGRVKDGDVVLCTEHSGDCFYDYKLIKVYANGLEIHSDSPCICGYTLGRESQAVLTARECCLLMAGEMVHMDERRVK